MKLLLDFPTIGEPHYAQAIPATLIKDKQVKFYKLAENTNPCVDAEPRADGGITRNGKRVHIKMIAIRSHFAPDNLEGVQVGDTVYFHVTNIEQDWDILHGFAVLGDEHVGADPAAGRDAHAQVDPARRRRLPVLLHRLLLGAAPGDAGLRPRVAGGIERGAHGEHRAEGAERGGADRHRRSGRDAGERDADCNAGGELPQRHEGHATHSCHGSLLSRCSRRSAARLFVLPLWRIRLSRRSTRRGSACASASATSRAPSRTISTTSTGSITTSA